VILKRDIVIWSDERYEFEYESAETLRPKVRKYCKACVLEYTGYVYVLPCSSDYSVLMYCSCLMTAEIRYRVKRIVLPLTTRKRHIRVDR
jgi:hypothetical protein